MRRKPAVPLAFALSLILLTVLSSACGSETATPIPTPTNVPTATEGAAATATVDPAQSVTAEPEVTGLAIEGDGGVSAGDVAAAVGSRTPVPTPTPDVIADKVEEFVAESGLSGKTFLGLSAEDWIDIGISLLIVGVGYLLALLGVKLFLAVVKQISDRVAVMYLGRIVELAAAADLDRGPAHPYTMALLEAAPEPDPTRPRAERSLLGEPGNPIDPPTGCSFHPRCRWATEECRRLAPRLKSTPELAPGHLVACHHVGQVTPGAESGHSQ